MKTFLWILLGAVLGVWLNWFLVGLWHHFNDSNYVCLIFVPVIFGIPAVIGVFADL